MAIDFQNMMLELSELVKEAEEAGPADIGGSVVNGMTGVVGSNALAKDVPGDASLRHPHKDGDVMKRPNKESEYPDRIRQPGGGRDSQKPKKSEIGDDDLRMEDKPEKRAALRAMRILDNIEDYIEGELNKNAETTLEEAVDQASLQKAASFELGTAAARRYLEKLAKEDGPLKNSPEHRGDLADTAVSQLVPRSDPHEASDNKSPESDPSQTKYEKASNQDQGNAHVEDTLQAKASLTLRKAQLMDELEKASRAQDPAQVLQVKAKIYDFVQDYKGVQV